MIKEISKQEIISTVRRISRFLPFNILMKIDEAHVLEMNKEFLRQLFNAEIYINKNYDPTNKKKTALPYKPAIHLE